MKWLASYLEMKMFQAFAVDKLFFTKEMHVLQESG